MNTVYTRNLHPYTFKFPVKYKKTLRSWKSFVIPTGKRKKVNVSKNIDKVLMTFDDQMLKLLKKMK